MLKTPECLIRNEWIKQVSPGFVHCGLNLDIAIWGRNAPTLWQGNPAFAILDEYDEPLNSYGVCDTPEQFIDMYQAMLETDPRTFIVGFTHIEKDPDNKGHGGGWRWHKWGPYIGKGVPEYEYLDDEEGFANGVYVYHIHQTAGPHLKRNWQTGQLEKGDGHA